MSLSIRRPERVAIIGAGGHGDTVAECLEPYGVPCIRLDESPRSGLHSPQDFFSDELHRDAVEAIVATGDNGSRRRLTEWMIDLGVRPATVRHPSSYLSSSAVVFPGSAILYGAHVGTRVRLGKGCIVNNLASIGHNCVLGDYVNVCDGTVFGGSVVVEDDVFIGLNCTILPKLRIGRGAVIGAGSVVTKDVPAGEMWAGNPAGLLR